MPFLLNLQLWKDQSCLDHPHRTALLLLKTLVSKPVNSYVREKSENEANFHSTCCLFVKVRSSTQFYNDHIIKTNAMFV